jgi:hypothetical protein
MTSARRVFLVLAALAWPVAAGAQSFDGKDWQVVCDNTRTCRAAGYSAEGSDAPVSVLVSRRSGAGMPVVVELQLGTLDPRSVHPASVVMAVGGKPAGTIRIDRNNHADLAPPVASALLKALVGDGAATFTAGRATWRLSGDGAAGMLGKVDEIQGRVGRPSALVRKGSLSDADVAYPMAVPRFEASRVPAATLQGDDALATRVVAAIPGSPDCPLLDDGAAQAKARLWHLDANRLLVTQPCRAAAAGTVQGYWLANLRPPYEARPLTLAADDFDGSTLRARATLAAAGDCGSVQAWTWNGYRFEPTWAATGGLCRGVKAGGAWELPSLVSDVVPAQ